MEIERYVIQPLPAKDISDIFAPVASGLSAVKESISKQLASSADSPAISRLIESFDSYGKMLRAAMVLLSAKACGGKISAEHIKIAAIIEMIHNATLLHDDVIDAGQKRRGKQTVNILWGNESAVLLGDLLLSQVFKMCTDLPPEVNRIIADTTARTCKGEIRQLAERQNSRLIETDYIDIITEKTAVIFSGSCYLGGLLAESNQRQLGQLRDFGLNLGIAFQITDDLLDITGDENKTGKTLGGDVDKNKLTLPMIHMLTTAGQSEKAKILDCCFKNNAVCDRKKLIEMLTSSGSLEYAKNRVEAFVQKAANAIADLEETDAKVALIEIANFIVGRPF